ncbi:MULTISPECIES: hypothetical protein [unclassified Serratia (in: enterobacteria)]|uniref:hypothetical protein n=1 Tax=unclassified Serratia (in: enterobacteria) TaxID=2647522 RepID=UPI00126803D2|nr:MULTISPECIES: hypothetical protein [unclassified Serratia (in: enterobacteria)]
MTRQEKIFISIFLFSISDVPHFIIGKFSLNAAPTEPFKPPDSPGATDTHRYIPNDLITAAGRKG